MRFRHYRPDRVVPFLEEYARPRKEYVSDMAEVPEEHPFITEDEINELISGGSSFESGKSRIFDFFQQPHTPKEKTDFLKKEYGTGGRNCALSHNFFSHEEHSPKGLHLDKPRCSPVELNWRKVSKYIDDLVSSGRYYTPEQLAEKQDRVAQKAA